MKQTNFLTVLRSVGQMRMDILSYSFGKPNDFVYICFKIILARNDEICWHFIDTRHSTSWKKQRTKFTTGSLVTSPNSLQLD